MNLAHIAILASIVTGPVIAQQAPTPVDRDKIDFTQILKDVDGQPYTECRKADEKNPSVCADMQPVTLGRLVLEVMNKSLPTDANATLDDILTRNRLARQVYTQASSLTASEKTLIENRLTKFGIDALEIGAAIAILDPAAISR